MGRLVQIGNKRRIVAEAPVLVATSTEPEEHPHRLEIHRPVGRTDYALELDGQEALRLAARLAPRAEETDR
jgi:hypothetical protein